MRKPVQDSLLYGPSVVDLFAGCGGLTSGFTAEGFRSLLAVEWDLHAAATYAANFGAGHVVCDDIANVRSADVPSADVVIGGPPCQGFSNLGTRASDDPRNRLWKEYMRVVLAADPQVFILENVDRFSRSSEFGLLMNELNGGRLRRWKDHAWSVLNTADYGVPQRRQRTILVASRVGPVPLPKPTHSKSDGVDKERWVTVRSAIGDVPFEVDTTELPCATVKLLGSVVPGIFKSPEIHIGRNPRPMSLERYDCIPPGGGRFDLPDHLMPPCWANKAKGTTDVMGRMRWDQPSLTIRTEFFKPEKGQYLHPQWDAADPRNRVNRPITHYEAALLQTFPKTFLWCGSKIGIAKQIGNAVPPRLAAAIAESVLPYLR